MNSSPIRVVVDRIEGELAVLVLFDDDRIKMDLPLERLPKGIREGDHLLMSFKKDESGRDAQRMRVAKLLEDLKAKNS